MEVKGGAKPSSSYRWKGFTGRASLWHLSRSSGPHKCRFHLGFSLGCLPHPFYPSISKRFPSSGSEFLDAKSFPICPGPGPRTLVTARNRSCRQKMRVCPDSFSLFWAALMLDCLWYSRCRRVQLWHRVSSGMEGASHSTQRPRSLDCSLLCCMLRRFSSLRSGVWDRRRSYSRRVSRLASTSAGVGWARGFGALGWGAALGVAFLRLVGFCLALGFAAVFPRGVVDFLVLPGRLGSLRVQLSTNTCLLGRSTPSRRCGSPAHAGIDPDGRGAVRPSAGFPRPRGDRPLNGNDLYDLTLVPPPTRG